MGSAFELIVFDMDGVLIDSEILACRCPIRDAYPAWRHHRSRREGLFWAKLSAASTLAIAPIMIFG